MNDLKYKAVKIAYYQSYDDLKYRAIKVAYSHPYCILNLKNALQIFSPISRLEGACRKC